MKTRENAKKVMFPRGNVGGKKVKALVVLLNVLRAAITESPTQLAVVDQRSCGRDAPPKWNVPATTRLQQVGARARSGDENCLRATFWRTRSHCFHAVLVSWQQTSLDSCSGRGGSASKIDDASVQFRFCAASLRAHGSARSHNNTHAYFVSWWEREAEVVLVKGDLAHSLYGGTHIHIWSCVWFVRVRIRHFDTGTICVVRYFCIRIRYYTIKP